MNLAKIGIMTLAITLAALIILALIGLVALIVTTRNHENPVSQAGNYLEQNRVEILATFEDTPGGQEDECWLTEIPQPTHVACHLYGNEQEEKPELYHAKFQVEFQKKFGFGIKPRLTEVSIHSERDGYQRSLDNSPAP